jgi:uncharacterized membrane protein YadS
LYAARRDEGAPGSGRKLNPLQLIPWFIIGFLALAGLRSLQLVPDIAVPAISKTATILTIVSMAALGLGVDVRVLSTVGGRVISAVTLSLLLLMGLSIAIVLWLFA